MPYTETDYEQPLDGHLDTRRLALFADNRTLPWEVSTKRKGLGWVATATVGGRPFEGEGKDYQSALDAAVESAIEALS